LHDYSKTTTAKGTSISVFQLTVRFMMMIQMIHQNDSRFLCRAPLQKKGPCEINNNVHTVLVIGDSNTWAFDPSSSGNGAATLRHPYSVRWTTQVEELFENRVHVIPEGLNARTTTIDDPLSPCDGNKSSMHDLTEKFWLCFQISIRPLQLYHTFRHNCLIWQENTTAMLSET
jgi:hypothetical protein